MKKTENRLRAPERLESRSMMTVAEMDPAIQPILDQAHILAAEIGTEMEIDKLQDVQMDTDSPPDEATTTLINEEIERVIALMAEDQTGRGGRSLQEESNTTMTQAEAALDVVRVEQRTVDELERSGVEERAAIATALGTEQDKLASLEDALQSAKTAMEIATVALTSAQNDVAAKTVNKDSAASVEQNAIKELDAAQVALNLAIADVEKYMASTTLVQSITKQIEESKQRVSASSLKMQKAYDAYKANPRDKAFRDAYYQEQTACRKVVSTEMKVQQSLNRQLTAARSQMTKDAPLLSKAQEKKSTAEKNLATATSLESIARTALALATNALSDAELVQSENDDAKTVASDEVARLEDSIVTEQAVITELQSRPLVSPELASAQQRLRVAIQNFLRASREAEADSAYLTEYRRLSPPAVDPNAPVELEMVEKTLNIEADPARTGMYEGRSSSYAEAHSLQLSGTLRSDIQIGQQYWAPNNLFLIWRGKLTFDTSVMPENTPMKSATVTLIGQRALNTGGDSLNVVAIQPAATAGNNPTFTSTILGTLTSENFNASGANIMTLNTSILESLRGQNDITIGLRLNSEMNERAPSANAFYLGSELPKLEVTYDALQPKVAPPFVPNPPEVKEVIDPATVMASAEDILSQVSKLDMTWSMEGTTNRLTALRDRGETLVMHAKELTTLASNIHEALMTTEDASVIPNLLHLEKTIQAPALGLAGAIAEWQDASQSLSSEALSSLSTSLQDSLIASQGIESLSLMHAEIDLSLAKKQSSAETHITESISVPDAGGTIIVQSLRGTSESLVGLNLGTIDGHGVLTGTGKASVIDLTQVSGTALSVRFIPTSSIPSDELTVTFLRGNSTIEKKVVASGTEVNYENADGITGVIIENQHTILSEDAKAFLDYKNNDSRGYYGDYTTFFQVLRKDLAPFESAIKAAVNIGEPSHPLTLSDLAITTDLSAIRTGHDAEAVSRDTSSAFAMMNASAVFTSAPDKHPRYQLNYVQWQYNTYQLKKFADNPTLMSVQYKGINGLYYDLPSEMWRMEGNTLIVYPSGQNLQLVANITGGSIVKTTSGEVANFEVVGKTSHELSNILPNPNAHIVIGNTTTYVPNEGGEEGWRIAGGSGSEASHRIPNAVGPSKISAEFINDGSKALNFTVNIYSGNDGTNGAGVIQRSYRGSLASGESRTLVTSPIGMNTSSNGAGFLRVVAIADDGTVLAESGRTVSAPSMTEAEQAAHADEVMKTQKDAVAERAKQTVEYLASIGIHVSQAQLVTQGNAYLDAIGDGGLQGYQFTDSTATTDPQQTERVLRNAVRGLYAAKISGDQQRIALEMRRVQIATTDHFVATATLETAQLVTQTPTAEGIIENEGMRMLRASGTPQGAVAQATYGLGVMQERLTDMIGIPEDMIKIISEFGEILTPMTTESLTRIRDLAEQGRDSALQRGDQLNAASFGALFAAADGLLRTPNDTHREEWIALIQKTTSDPTTISKVHTYELSKGNLFMPIQNGEVVQETVNLDARLGHTSSIKFTIDEEKMVNFGADGMFSRDLSLTIFGSGLGLQSYSSAKNGLTGESVSLRLPAGTYTLLIENKLAHTVPAGVSGGSFNIPVQMNIQKPSGKTEGMMTIDGSDKVMPVRMSVAEFFTDENNQVKRKTDYDLDPKNGGVNKLDPSKPVWVVIHGMDSKPEASVMNELTKALSAYKATNGIQVVTIDWKEAAASGFIMTQDAPWTTAVGKWAANQLLNVGFSPNQINVAGWSHGTFVGFEMGQELKKHGGGEMNTFVALDAARNLPIISGYNHSPDFSSVSKQSIAFDSSVIAGADALATTADYTFMVRSNEASPTVRHRLAVTTFTRILDHEMQNPGQFSEIIDFEKLMNGMSSEGAFQENAFAGGFEGCIDIGVERQTIDNDTYYKALPSVMRIIRPNETQETLLHFTSTDA